MLDKSKRSCLRGTDGEPIKVAHRKIRGKKVRYSVHGDVFTRKQVQAVERLKMSSRYRPANMLTPAAGPTMPATWCGTAASANRANLDSGPVIKLVYAYPADRANRFATYADLIQDSARNANEVLGAASGDTRWFRWDMGTDCGDQYVDVQVVRLPQTAAYYTSTNRFGRTATDVSRVLGPAVGKRNVAIFADHIGGGASGQGAIGGDSSPEQTNWMNAGGWSAIVYGRGGGNFFGGPATDPGYVRYVLIHEVMHTLGAVQLDAPHNSGGWHCNDTSDYLCYGDGGPRSRPFSRCAQLTFDCGRDTYFSVTPPAGSYLRLRWNTASSVFMGRPTNVAPVATMTRDFAGDQIKMGSTVSFRSGTSTDSDGWIVRRQWDFNGDGTWDHTSPQPLAVSWRYGATGVKTVKLRVVDDAGEITETTFDLTIYNAPPTAQLNLSPNNDNIKLRAAVTLSAAGSADSDGSISAYEWDANGDNVVDYRTASATHRFGALGPKTIRLRVRDDSGTWSAWVTRDVTVYNAAPTAQLNMNPSDTNIKLNAPIAFSATGSADSDGTLTGYEWDVNGDNRVDYLTASATHRFGALGPKTVRLRVRDDSQVWSDWVTQNVTVYNAAPTAVIGKSFSGTNAPINTLVTFNASDSVDSDGSVRSYQWDVNGDTVVDGTTNTYNWTYRQAGPKTVRLRVADDSGVWSPWVTLSITVS